MARLEYEICCPACGHRERGKRRAGEDVLLQFECKGINWAGVKCGQRYTLKFFDEDSEEERSKDRWKAGHGDDWTDFKLR